MIRFNCPGCGKAIKVDDASGGRTAKCRSCGQQIKVPPCLAPDAPPPFSGPLPKPNEPPPIPGQDILRAGRRSDTATESHAWVETNVQQGAVIGGWVCFAVALVCMFHDLMRLAREFNPGRSLLPFAGEENGPPLPTTET